MLRTLKTVMRQDREKFKIPKSIQQAMKCYNKVVTEVANKI